MAEEVKLPRPRQTRLLSHAGPIAAFAVLVALWMHGFAGQLDVVVPGDGAGDNLTFLWNLWWMRTALADPQLSFWTTPFLFHPFGVNIALDTHTALEGAVAAVAWPGWSIVKAQNVWILLHLFLNLVCTYAVAWRAFRHRGGAVVAAMVFGASPYVSAHLLGHFNLIAAWILPLTALLADLVATSRPKVAWALALGTVLGTSLYLDYYYSAYCLLLAVLLLLPRVCSLEAEWSQRPSPWRTKTALALLAVLGLDLVVIVWIAASGGADLALGGHIVRMHGLSNPLSLAGLLVLGALLAWFAPRELHTRWQTDRRAELLGLLAISFGVAAAVGSAVLLQLFGLWQRGEYVTQAYLWRSAPAGIDAGTLVLGNPFGALTGSAVQRLYSRLGIDMIEQAAWVGPGILALAVIAVRRLRYQEAVRVWLWPAAVFILWAAGPRLAAFGRDTNLLLPAIGIRYLPLLANARIPGRAMVVVYLVLAMLAAAGVCWLWQRGRRGRLVAFGLAALVLLDAWPMAPPLSIVERSRVYEVIRSSNRPGAVCELPIGVRDGFGVVGAADSQALLNQTTHGRPIVGGFVARLPPSVLTRYREMPVVGALLRLSNGGAIEAENVEADRAEAGAALVNTGIRFVVVDHRKASRALEEYVHEVLPLAEVARDGPLTAYVVRPQ